MKNIHNLDSRALQMHASNLARLSRIECGAVDDAAAATAAQQEERLR